ncbi:MAG: glutamate--tRNA ligase family protein [Cystobacterineae bacterium]|nr:glutamate--tRNA ligase family protein [Cystobacterineae bacterium]MCL2258899.1 glutamate--tRNA ligase family protein [Cystobacterineae bacterium]
MHLGNAFVALLSWLWAQQQNGHWLLRIEDLDSQRCKPEYARLLLEDLRFLGLSWEAKPLLQSQRHNLYAQAVARLQATGHCFECHCSRREMALALAPHAGENTPSCTGRCRPGNGRPASLRFRCAPNSMSPNSMCFEDAVLGPQYPQTQPRDFVLCREGQYSYQLAVVVDDAAQGIHQVLRGADLVEATFCQIQLQKALGFCTPTYAHVPCLGDSQGQRLSKRGGALSIAALRARGMRGPQLVGLLAKLAHIGDGQPSPPEALVPHFHLGRLRGLHPRVDEGLLPP